MALLKYVLIFTSFCLCVPSQYSRIFGPSDFCEHEYFVAQCNLDEEVVMETSRYGRMQVGRCIEGNYRIGCSMDVLPVMDDLCSGLPKCSVATVDPKLISTKASSNVCKGLLVYLEASYKCIKVLSRKGNCVAPKSSNDQPQGFISSRISTETGHGGPGCPWKLSSDGAVINITLWKFPKQSEQSLLSPSSSLCYEIGKIKEGSVNKNIMVCGTDKRQRHIYTSSGGELEISFAEKSVMDTLGRFILKYEAKTCSFPKEVENGHATLNVDVVTIQCNFSNTKWIVKCTDMEQWNSKGHQCPAHEVWTIDEMFPHDEISVGLVLVVILGLTVFICSTGFLAYLIYFYCKRCKENVAHQRAVNTRDYTDEEKKGTENLIKFPENDVKYRENTLRSNAGSSDTSSLDKRTISWPIRESFRHSSHADTLQFPDEHESESVSVEDETINSHVPSEDAPDYGKPLK